MKADARRSSDFMRCVSFREDGQEIEFSFSGFPLCPYLAGQTSAGME